MQAVNENKELIRQLQETAKQLRNSVTDTHNDDDDVQLLNSEDELELGAESADFTLVQ